MQVFLINALQDNYIFAITKGNYCVIVDPGDAKPVNEFLDNNHLHLSGILVTHHHHDHTGGIANLKKTPVWGHYKSPCQYINEKIYAEESFQIPKINITVIPIMTPGHTNCHITYIVGNYAFVGDTLFSAGCGRIFEGDYSIMYQSLLKIKSFNDHTLIFCAHEYTEKNLLFAQSVEPDNLMAQKHLAKVQQLRRNQLPTIPTSINLEKQINPFLRCNSLADFIALRKQKDLW